MLFKRRQRGRGERGQSIIEFALIAPVFFGLFFTVLECGLMLNTWVTVQHAAGRGARFAVTNNVNCSASSAGRMACIQAEVKKGMSSLKNGESAPIAISSWDYPSFPTKRLNDAGEACDAVEVAVTYRYEVKLPLVSLVIDGINLTGKQRFVNEPFGFCD